jgi:hypothetical protein
MNGCDVDGFECGTSLLAKTPKARQHFFLFWVAPGFIGYANKWQAFFSIF